MSTDKEKPKADLSEESILYAIELLRINVNRAHKTNEKYGHLQMSELNRLMEIENMEIKNEE